MMHVNFTTLGVAITHLAMLSTPALTVAGDVDLRAKLVGFEEVAVGGGVTSPALMSGSVSTQASGRFRGEINDHGTELAYELSYEGLEGMVTQGHIHVGQRRVAGGISVWLCQTALVPAPLSVAALTPTCPASGKVTGTLTAANVIGPAGQGIAAGEFAELVGAIRGGVTYANVHSTKFPAGEVRGQIRANDDD